MIILGELIEIVKKAVLKIRIRWIRKILASCIRIRKNMRIYGSRSKGQNINQKLQKKYFFTL